MLVQLSFPTRNVDIHLEATTVDRVDAVGHSIYPHLTAAHRARRQYQDPKLVL
jgi:hypothetical protein